MSGGPIHPLAGGLASSSFIAERAAAERSRQLRQAKKTIRKGTADEDFFDRQVETADAVDPLHDQSHGQQEQPRKQPKPRPQADAEQPPRLDLTA